MVQIALITHALGLDEYGIFVLAVSFVEVIGRFFSLQVGDTPIAFASEKLQTDPRAAARILEVAYTQDGPTLFLLNCSTLVRATVAVTSPSRL